MPKLKRHKQFVKDLKTAKLTDEQFQKLVRYLNLLLEGKSLPPEAKNHPLKGEYKGFWEFHLGGDMLVIYHKGEDAITLTRIGTHARLFK